MNFTNSPYEPFMKQPSHYCGPVGPELAPKGIECMTCYRELLKKPGDKK